MFEREYRRELERMGPGAQQVELAVEALRRERVRGKKRRSVRAVLAAAVVCAAMVVTVAAAALLGAFDFLKEQDEYAFLGQTEIYEAYAYEVNNSVTADNGDVLSVDRMAMDGRFCTIFYSIRFREPVVGAADLEKGKDTGVLRRTAGRTPYFALYAGEEEISEEGYQNSFETQQYLADTSTAYGAWRFLLARPLAEGERLRFQGELYGERNNNGAGELLWEASLTLEAHPIPMESFAPGVSFAARLQGETVAVQALCLERSPLGTLLTLRHERMDNEGLGMEFALRDADTGAYIPFAEVFTSHYKDPEGYRDNVYELFGDVSGLKNLELIPVRWLSAISPRMAVDLDALPAADCGNPDGGYAPASYAVEEGRIVVAMKPVGAATNYYAMIGNGVYFLDKDGNELFSDIHVKKYKDRSDGTITVVSTPGGDSFRKDADKVAQISFFVHQYELLPGQAVRIPLSE